MRERVGPEAMIGTFALFVVRVKKYHLMIAVVEVSVWVAVLMRQFALSCLIHASCMHHHKLGRELPRRSDNTSCSDAALNESPVVPLKII